MLVCSTVRCVGLWYSTLCWFVVQYIVLVYGTVRFVGLCYSTFCWFVVQCVVLVCGTVHFVGRAGNKKERIIWAFISGYDLHVQS